MKPEKPVFVQLRLPPAMAEKLRQSGEEYWRKLPAEIMYRLQRSLDYR